MGSSVPEITEGAAQRRWATFVRSFNKRAHEIGAPQIQTLASLGDPLLVTAKFVPEEEVRRIQLRYYEHLIDTLDPLASVAFDYLREQRTRAKGPRGGLSEMLHFLVTGPGFGDLSDRQLWDYMLGSGRDFGLTIAETDGGIEWDERDGDRCGEMTFASFCTALSRERKRQGLLKRPRRKG